MARCRPPRIRECLLCLPILTVVVIGCVLLGAYLAHIPNEIATSAATWTDHKKTTTETALEAISSISQALHATAARTNRMVRNRFSDPKKMLNQIGAYREQA